MITTLAITFLLILVYFIWCWVTLDSDTENLFPDTDQDKYLEEHVPYFISSAKLPKPTESIKIKNLVMEPNLAMEPKPKQKAPKKPEIDKQKLQDYCDILKAIGFTSSEAKSKTKSLLTQNPKLTEQELLREATK